MDSKTNHIPVLGPAALCVCALLFRILFNWDLPMLLTRDSFGYLDMTRLFIQRGTLDVFLPHRTPGFPIFLSAVFSLAGESGRALNGIHSLLSVLSSVCMFYAARRLTGSLALAYLLLCITLFQPFVLIFENILLTEVLALSLLSIFVWQYSRLVSGVARWSGFVFLASILVLIRPNLLIFVAIPIAHLILRACSKGWRQGVRMLALAGLSGILVPLWMLFVWHTTGVFHLTANSNAGRFEGLKGFEIAAGSVGSLGEELGFTGEGSEMQLGVRENHYKEFDVIARELRKRSPGKQLRVYGDVEQFYQTLIKKVNNASGMNLPTAQFYVFLSNIGLSIAYGSDIEHFLQSVLSPVGRAGEPLCDVYGNAASVYHLNQECIEALSGSQRSFKSTEFREKVLRLLEPLHWNLNRFSALFFLVSAAIAFFDLIISLWRRIQVEPLSVIAISLFLSVLAHAYLLAASGRYFEVFSREFFLVALSSFILFGRVRAKIRAGT